MNEALNEDLPHIGGYDISRRLGRGGMADVYLAVQSSLSRPVAIKVLAADRLEGEETAKRFEHEARTIARLDHPNIVSIFDVGHTDDGRLYYVMPYLPNGDLSTRDLRDSEGAVITIARALCQALGYAHQHDIVHRDVKPENVLFDKLDRPLLADFGIALAARDFIRVTREGSTIGSSGYMSPEQSRGQALDGRADLYSLGVVTYEMLTGDLPYKGPDTLAVALAHLEQPIPRLPSRRRHWQAFIDKAMAKAPDERFQNAAQMEAALDALAAQYGDSPAGTYATKPMPAMAQPSRRGLRSSSGIGLAIALSVAGAGLLVYAMKNFRHAPAAITGISGGSADAPASSGGDGPSDAPGAAAIAPTATIAAEGVAQVETRAGPEQALANPVSADAPAKAPAADLPKPAPAPKPRLADLATGAAMHDRNGPELVFVPAALTRNDKTFDVGHPFALARHEVTVREYTAFVSAANREASKCREPHSPLSAFRKLSWREPGFAQDDTHPVVCVSWSDANAYVQWLATRTHEPYRLPTRAEWVHANHWNSSSLPACAQGNLADAKRAPLHGDAAACSDGFAYTAPVGKFKANALGVYDLIGNVSEWSRDCKAANAKAGDDSACKERLFSGSSWRDEADRGPDFQDDAETDIGYTTIGFRVLRELDDNSIPASVK